MVSAVTKKTLPICLLPSMPDTARLPKLSQRTVDINMTPVTLRCTVLFQKILCLLAGCSTRTTKCDLQYQENEFELRFHSEKIRVLGPKLYKYTGTSLCLEQSITEFAFSLLLLFSTSFSK